MSCGQMIAKVLGHPRLVAGTLLAAAALAAAVVLTLQATAGEATPAAAMDRTLKALKSHDADALRTVVSPDLEQASPDLGQAALGRRWASQFGGFTAAEPPTLTTSESDSFVFGQVQGVLKGEPKTLRVLLQRCQNGRWFTNGIGTN